MRGLGTIINTATVVIGGGCGAFFGRKIPARLKDLVVQTIGLVTIGLGLSDVLKTHNMVIPLVSLVVGGILGELLKIEDLLECLGSRLQRRFASSSDESSFVRGFVTASLLFCVGPLTILGALQDASGETPQLYIIKGTLDGFMSMVLTAAHGIGAAFSALSVFVVQGSLTVAGTSIDALLTDRMQTEMFATGGFAVLAIGLNLLQLTKIRLGSLIPSLVVAPIVVWLFAVPTGLIH
jgi:uncharacterized membrane protein YqgA involved in biofilm formation